MKPRYKNLLTNQCPCCDSLIETYDAEWVRCSKRCGFWMTHGRMRYLRGGMQPQKKAYASTN